MISRPNINKSVQSMNQDQNFYKGNAECYVGPCIQGSDGSFLTKACLERSK